VKLLVVTPRFPYPIERGDKLRAFHQIRQLTADHEVTLVALSEGPVDPAALDAVTSEHGPTVHVISRSRLTTLFGVLRALLTGVPLTVGYFRSRAAARRIDEIIATERPDRIYCQLIRTAAYGRDRGVPTMIDYQDCFSAAAQRRATRSHRAVRWLFQLEARRVRRYEAQAFAWFDHHVIISEQDRAMLDFAGSDRVEVLPNGVDTEFFAPRATTEVRRDIVFVGNMGYPPNVDAVGLLCAEILPLVRERRPDTDLLIAGARPSRSVRQLEGPGVEVSGWIDDIRTAYARGRIMVAPLMIGAGQQNKILEAMAMGIPCVTTELVNRAIGATDGVEVLIGGTPEEFADHIVALLESPERREEMAAHAQRFVEQRYSWAAVGDRLEELLDMPTDRRSDSLSGEH